jgi:pimeloyl-ACP methyl ester carboxylesterase
VQIARCRAHAACRRAFPDTRAELTRVLARHPREADALATAVAVLLRSPEDAERVPFLVHEAAAGDTAPLAREFATHVGRELDARSRLPMFWVTICNERWARFGVAATARASRGSYLSHAAVARATLFRQACAVVPRTGSAAGDQGARPSRVPVLLLAGDGDPQDPPANLAGWRALFPNGQLVSVPGLAHGVIAYGCLRLVVARFVARGSARSLDIGCTRVVGLPRFELS